MTMGLIILPGQEPEPEFEIAIIEHAELRELVRETVERNRLIPRSNPLQKRIDELAADYFAADEIEMAAALLQLSAARVANVVHHAVTALLETMIGMMPMIAMSQKCRVCGCTNTGPCLGGCEWVSIDLCSRCEEGGKP
jgi:hypothetical protein